MRSRRARIGLVGIVLLTAAAIGESLAFIGGLFDAPKLAWVGYAIVVVAVLVVVAKLLRESADRTCASDAEGPE